MADSAAKRKNGKTRADGIGFAPVDFQAALLNWYDAQGRDLPWREKNGNAADPYRVWLSEVMLQQTTVKAVIPYYLRFLEKWPTVQNLAAASRDEVLAAWAGLGYYSRARNLHTCAQAVTQTGFPSRAKAFRELPGIGPYTAAAIAAIAFGEAAAVVDGNVERVLARIFAIQTPLPAAKAEINSLAALLTPCERPGDYAQAMMDLGATICTPRSPSCLVCPVRSFCAAAGSGTAQLFPVKIAKTERPTRSGHAFLIVSNGSHGPSVLLRKRADKGLLGGMYEVPGTAWYQRESGIVMAGLDPAIQRSHSQWEFAALDGRLKGGHDVRKFEWKTGRTVRHTFTHFHLELAVSAASCNQRFPAEGEWAPLPELDRFALPTVMRKVIASGLAALGIEYQAAGTDASSASRVSRVDRSALPSTSAGRK